MDGRHHRVSYGVIGLAVALAAAPALAQGEASPDGSTILFQEGVEHLRAGRHREAVEAFRGSYRLRPRVTAMCNLALAYDGSGPEHREDAVRAYRTCAADDDTGRFGPHALERITAIERELVLTDGEPPVEDVVAPPPEPAEPPTEPSVEPPAEPDHALLFAGLGAAGGAAIALVTGIVLALDAQARVAGLEADVPDGRIVRGSPEAQRLDAARATADGATAAYVVAGVLAALGAGAVTADLVVALGNDSSVSIQVHPLGIRGTF